MRPLRLLAFLSVFLAACATAPTAQVRLADTLDQANGRDLDRADLEGSCDMGERAACAYFGTAEVKNGHLDVAERAFRKSCDLGDFYGCQKLGAFFYEQTRFEEAWHAFTRPCDAGLDDSCAYLGLIESSRHHVKKAKGYLQKVCDHGNVMGCTRLAYLDEFDGEYEKAKENYQTSCDHGESLVSCMYAGEMKYLLGNSKTGKAELNLQCEKGSPHACRMISALAKKPKQLLEQCNSGDGKSCHELGLVYSVQKSNRKKSEIYYKKGCDLQDAFSCWEISYNLERRSNLKEFYPKTHDACALGVGIACYNEGMNIRATDEDSYFQSRAAFQKSCDLGEAWGCIQVSELQKACDLGNPDGCYELSQKLPVGAQKNSLLFKACERHLGDACEDLGYEAIQSSKITEGISYYEKACEEKVPSGCDWATWEKYKQNPKDEFIEQLASRCKAGYKSGCSRAAKILEDKTNKSEFKRYLKSGCDLDDTWSCASLGYQTLNEKNTSEAKKWMRKACDLGDSWSCRGL